MKLVEGKYLPIENILKENAVLSNARVIEGNGLWNVVSYHPDFTGKTPSRLSDEVVIHSFMFPVEIQVIQYGDVESHSRGIIYKTSE